MLGAGLCRFGDLLLQAHRQLFLIYLKMVVISLTAQKHFACWNLKHVTPACSEWQAKLRSWVFSKELMSENISRWMRRGLVIGSGVCTVCLLHWCWWRSFGREGRWIFTSTFEHFPFVCFCWVFVLLNFTSSYYYSAMLCPRIVCTMCIYISHCP